MILIGGEQKNQAIKTDGICTCLCSSMGSGGGYVPMIVEEEDMKAESRKQKAESRKQKAESRKQKNCKAGENRVKCLGWMEKGTGKHQSNCVYSVDGLSPTICAGLGVKMPGLYIVEE